MEQKNKDSALISFKYVNKSICYTRETMSEIISSYLNGTLHNITEVFNEYNNRRCRLRKTITLISSGISRNGSNVSETALQFKHLTK